MYSAVPAVARNGNGILLSVVCPFKVSLRGLVLCLVGSVLHESHALVVDGEITQILSVSIEEVGTYVFIGLSLQGFKHFTRIAENIKLLSINRDTK